MSTTSYKRTYNLPFSFDDVLKLIKSFSIEDKVTILDTKTESGVIQLTQDQLNDIIESKKEIEKGLFLENSTLDKQVHQWLNVK